MISLAAFATVALASLGVADRYWANRTDTCPRTYVSAMVAPWSLTDGQLAGASRDSHEDCAVSIDAQYPMGARDLCKLIVHEVGHLRGVKHSMDPRSVMYTPFRPDPTPAGCKR